MGHIRLGRLPKTFRWQGVLALLSQAPSDIPGIARATVAAAEGRFRELASDAMVGYSFWLLSRVTSAARGASFPDELASLGLHVRDGDSTLAFASLIADRVREEATSASGIGARCRDRVAGAAKRPHRNGGPGRPIAIWVIAGGFTGGLAAVLIGSKLWAHRAGASLATSSLGRFALSLSASCPTTSGPGSSSPDRREPQVRVCTGPPRAPIGSNCRGLRLRLVWQTQLGIEGGDQPRRSTGIRRGGHAQTPHGIHQGTRMSAEPFVFACDEAVGYRRSHSGLVGGARDDHLPWCGCRASIFVLTIFRRCCAAASPIAAPTSSTSRRTSMPPTRRLSRGGVADAYGVRWRRRMVMCIPVSDPEFWSQDAVRSHLSRTLNVLTDDRWEFHFSRAQRGVVQQCLNFDARKLHGHRTR